MKAILMILREEHAAPMSGLEIDIQTSNTGASSGSNIHQNFSSCSCVYAFADFLD
jgi:hypothetical protein